jgi:hypothetical protein
MEIVVCFAKFARGNCILCFVIVHIPLFTVLMWLTNHEYFSIQHWSRITVATFLIIHVWLHKLLENDPNYTFNSSLSLSLIYCSGLFGLLYLILDSMFWQRNIDEKSAKSE